MQKKETKSVKEEKTHEQIMEVADEQKREFMKKFGRYAATAPVAMFVLMTPDASAAPLGSDTGPK